VTLQAPPIQALCTFVPAKDYDASKRFYQHLGFEVVVDFAGGAGGILALGSCSFILQ
jgi:catechol 2,3-dioxygenase-like lactoylglutathione lyase family enzyme